MDQCYDNGLTIGELEKLIKDLPKNMKVCVNEFPAFRIYSGKFYEIGKNIKGHEIGLLIE